MKITQRNLSLTILWLIASITGILIVTQAVDTKTTTEIRFTTAASFVFSLAMAIAYWRGWQTATYIQLIFLTVITGLAMRDPTIVSFVLLTPPIIAVILASPRWILISGFTIYTIALLASNVRNDLSNPSIILVYVLQVLAIYVGRLYTATLQGEAEANAARADAERLQVQEQAEVVAQANQRQEQQLAEQSRLLELVSTLETPSVRLADGVLFSPIVGNVDSQRATRITERLLKDVHEQRTKLVVLDISGVMTVDTSVARALLRTAQSLRLLGCDVTISGISAEVAMTLTSLGVGFEQIKTVRSPQEALTDWFSRPQVVATAPTLN